MMQEDELHRALRAEDAQFDREAGLLRGVVGPTRYHTRLAPGTPVHPTRESMVYAAALWESPEPWRRRRARDILDLLLPLQEIDPSHPFCGIWPWYFEEPLAAMAPPDGNWADFLGVQLVRILRNDRGEEGPGRAVGEALHRAAVSIRTRNVRLSYTNIAVMGTYVCVMAGQLLDDPSLLAYGRDRLRGFVAFTREAGGFPEYNSPTYTVVTLVELSRMLRDFPEQDQEPVREIHDLAWKEIAAHWHRPSGQWAGPHSRSYATLLQPETLDFLRRGVGGVIPGAENLRPSLDWCTLPVRCPAEWVDRFADRAPRFQYSEVVSQGEPPLTGSTHAEPEFVLSSAERGTFWNQSRPLVAYAPSANGPVALAIRFLHDGYDFCSGNLLARQEGGRVLAGVCLAHDGGDKHGELDRFRDGRIAATDWRLRFELLNVPGVPAGSLAAPWTIPFGDAAEMVLHGMYGAFGEALPRLETVKLAQGWAIDVVFYAGPRRQFHFHSRFPACFAFGLGMRAVGNGVGPGPSPDCRVEGEHLALRWGALSLAAPRYPLAEAAIVAFARRTKHGMAKSPVPPQT